MGVMRNIIASSMMLLGTSAASQHVIAFPVAAQSHRSRYQLSPSIFAAAIFPNPNI